MVDSGNPELAMVSEGWFGGSSNSAFGVKSEGALVDCSLTSQLVSELEFTRMILTHWNVWFGKRKDERAGVRNLWSLDDYLVTHMGLQRKLLEVRYWWNLEKWTQLSGVDSLINKDVQTNEKQYNPLVIDFIVAKVKWIREDFDWAKLRFQLVWNVALIASGPLQREKVYWENRERDEREYLYDFWSKNVVKVEEKRKLMKSEITLQKNVSFL